MGDVIEGLDHPPATTRPRRSVRRTRLSSRRGIRNTAAGRSPISFSVDGWDGMAAIFDLVIAKKGQFTPEEAMDFPVALEEPEQPARPDFDRPRDPRHRPEHLYPQGREGRRQARQGRVRDDPQCQGPVEGAEPGEVIEAGWSDAVRPSRRPRSLLQDEERRLYHTRTFLILRRPAGPSRRTLEANAAPRGP